jgi:hypothetical protein
MVDEVPVVLCRCENSLLILIDDYNNLKRVLYPKERHGNEQMKH